MMTKILRASLLWLLILGSAIAVRAQNVSSAEMRSLDGQVQEAKSDVLAIASQLDLLEERLLYPSGTQFSLFVSVAEDQSFRLDAVEIHVDGELAAHHIYSYQELEALQKGGVQRIFTGNVPTGDHALGVTMLGKFDNGKDFHRSGDFAFQKGVEPKALGITLASPSLGRHGIQVEDW